MQDPDFAVIVDQIRKEDSRYDKRAYSFVRSGLDYAVCEMQKRDRARASQSRHITGQELLDGLRVYSLDQFGPLTRTVLESWGVSRCEDFGEIVFNLIEYGILSKTDEDKKEDFASTYTFTAAFEEPFLPAKRRVRRPSDKA
jgi:uncharacterized repeat protein (TIGR04138 family)